MKIKGQKITITEGDSFSIPFVLIASEGDILTHFDESDKLVFVIQPCGECCDIIKKEITGVNGTEFDVFVSKEESKKLCAGAYEYGVYVENGENRLTLVKPTTFTVERGV